MSESTEMSSYARALLAEAKGSAPEDGFPSDSDVQRVRARLLKRVGYVAAAGALGATVATTSKVVKGSALAWASWASLAVKAVVVTAVGVGAVGTVVYTREAKRAAEASAPAETPVGSGVMHVLRGPPLHHEVPAASVAPLDSSPRGVVPLASSPTAASARGVPMLSVQALPLAPRAHAVRAGPSGSAGAAEAEPVASLGPDVTHLRLASAALGAGEARRALDELDAVSVTSPLAEERDALRALAQCALGSPAAEEAARRFLRQRRASALAPRVRAECHVDE